MKIGFVLRAPTQMDTPFFRYVATNLAGELRVLYTRQDQLDDRVFDAELGREVSWGMDLLEGYPHAVLPSRRRLAWLLHELRADTPDLLIVNGYNEAALVTAALAAKGLSVPVALRLDTPSFRMEHPAKQGLRRALYTGFSRLFDHFLPVGSSAAEFLQAMGIEHEQMSRFPYPVDLDHFRRGSALDARTRVELRRGRGLRDDETVVMALTKFHPRESPWDLLHAYCAMDSPGASLWLLGDGPERQALEEYVRSHRRGRVVFGGYMPYAELPTAYGLADAFVHPARYEPWGASVQEALACGLPVLASSKVGAARDFVTPGRNGFTYRAGDARDLRDKFPQLLSLVSSAEARRTTEQNLAKCAYPRIWTMINEVAQRCSPRRHATPREA